MKVLFFSFFIFLLCSVTAQNTATSVREKIMGWQASPGWSTASIGLAVCDSRTGEMIIKPVPNQSLVPASILKLVTTATALEVFGPDFRFQTILSAAGIVRNDTLFGNLQIIGGGDPTLGSYYFPENNHFMEEWIKAIQQKNIKVIAGDLVLDASIYDPKIIPDTWIWEDIGNYYGAGASAISVYDNQYEIHLKSAKEAGVPTRLIKIFPEIEDLTIQNEVLSSDINSDQAYVYGGPLEYRRIIRGTIPKNKSDFVIKASVPDASALLASQFRKSLKENGILITGLSRFEKSKNFDIQSVIYSGFQSPPLREIIKVTNYESVNLFAEHLLKHLEFNHSGLGSTKEGCQFIVDFWKGKELDMNGFFMNDGSGLSRFNGVTPLQMVNILNYMKTKSAWSSEFYESLATVGKGTLKSFKPENFPNECLHAKSGSMTRVRCFAGYLTSASGRQLSFCIMLNNFSCTQGEAFRKAEELLVELRKL